MTPTLASVHSALRLAKGLTIASIKANMESTKDPEKCSPKDKHFEDTPHSGNETRHNVKAAHYEEQIPREEAADRKGSPRGLF